MAEHQQADWNKHFANMRLPCAQTDVSQQPFRNQQRKQKLGFQTKWFENIIRIL